MGRAIYMGRVITLFWPKPSAIRPIGPISIIYLLGIKEEDVKGHRRLIQTTPISWVSWVGFVVNTERMHAYNFRLSKTFMGRASPTGRIRFSPAPRGCSARVAGGVDDRTVRFCPVLSGSVRFCPVLSGSVRSSGLANADHEVGVCWPISRACAIGGVQGLQALRINSEAF
jgi:hypothetical protein